MGQQDDELPELPLTISQSPAEASAGRQAVTELLGDRYQIVGKLGSGAFGEVYEALDTSLQRKVAIKRIRLDAFAEGPELEEVKQRFVREAQVAAQLRHPNVVMIHDIAAKGASSFMVMELVAGRTLQALLHEKGRLDLELTLRLLSQAAAALDYAHQSGIVHRDVKPANLMIEPSGQVKVMDFGIAKASASGNITRTGAILGTPNYMSPEQARGGEVDGRADLFSLGCILYECLAGQKPFAGESVTAILLKIISEAPPALDFNALKLPAPLGEVLKRALAKDPGERYASGRQLIEAVAQAGGVAQAVPSPPTARIAPTLVAPQAAAACAAPASRKSFGWTRAAVIAAALAAGAGLLWTAVVAQRARSRADAGTAAAAERPRTVQVSSRVAREDPGLVGRLLGSRPRFHVSVPEGSALRVRLETPLSSGTARADQEFTASSEAALVIEGFEAVPAGSRVVGHVAHAAGAGKLSGRGELTLEFDRILTPDGTEIPIQAAPLQRRARSTAKKDAGKVAGGVGLGAVVGGILGGRKGAAIGGAVGGSAGAGVVLATKGEEVELPEGTPLEVQLRSPFTVTVQHKEEQG